MKPTLKQLTVLRRIGRIVDGFSTQSRANHHFCEEQRLYRSRRKERVRKLELEAAGGRSLAMQNGFPTATAAAVAAKVAEIDDLKTEIAESEADEGEVREKWQVQNAFAGPYNQVFSAALERFRLTAEDLGIASGEREEPITQVAV